MRVFVTGATGFIGREITSRLRAAGHQVRVLARTPGSRGAQALATRAQAQVYPGDVLDASSIYRGLADVDAVLHVVGIISETGSVTFENLHTVATGNVVEAARAAGLKRLLHMSALGTRPGAVSRYHQTKWAAEEAVRNSGLAWTIFRPSLVYGPEDHFVNLFASMSRFSPALPVMGPGRSRFQPVAVEVVAEAFVKALTEPRAIGQTLDLCGPDTLTFRQILQEILAAVQRKRLIVSVPLPLARVQAACLEFFFGRLLRRPPPLNRDQLVMLQEDTVGDPEPARELFNLRQRSFAEGVRRYLRGNTF